MSIHILQFFSMLGNGGAENRMMDVYRHLDPDIVQFDFAVLHEGEQFFDKEIRERGAQKYVLPDPRKGLIRNYVALVRFFREHKEFQAVHAHLAWYSGVVLLAAKQAGIKVRIAHARDSKNINRSFITSIVCNIGKVFIQYSATQRIAISKNAAENIFGRRPVNKGKYLFVPNSIDISKYKVLDPISRDTLRRSFGIPENVKAYVTVASLRKQKNHTFLLDIAKELKQIDGEFILFLIGEGSLKNDIREKAKLLGLSENVLFLGGRSDVPEILGAFDAMIFPSLFEGLGGVVLEAQLVGIPVFCSDRIPKEADVGLGLVTSISLSTPPIEWAKTIVKGCEKTDWSRESVIKRFKELGYSIENTASFYLREYGLGEKEIKQAILP